jgi:hypothetical protein
MLMGRLAGPDRLANLSHAELPRAGGDCGSAAAGWMVSGRFQAWPGGRGPNLRRRVCSGQSLPLPPAGPGCWHVASSGVCRCAPSMMGRARG